MFANGTEWIAALARESFTDGEAFLQFATEAFGEERLRAWAENARGMAAEGFDVAEAVYWLAADWGGSEHDPLRRAENCTGFRPGANDHGPRSAVAMHLYRAMSASLAAKERKRAVRRAKGAK